MPSARVRAATSAVAVNFGRAVGNGTFPREGKGPRPVARGARGALGLATLVADRFGEGE